MANEKKIYRVIRTQVFEVEAEFAKAFEDRIQNGMDTIEDPVDSSLTIEEVTTEALNIPRITKYVRTQKDYEGFFESLNSYLCRETLENGDVEYVPIAPVQEDSYV